MARFKLEEDRHIILFEDKILVKVIKQEDLKQGSIIVPETEGSKDNVLAEVVQLPMEHPDWEIPVRIGDQVIISKFGGIEVNISEEDYKVLRVSDTVVTFRKDK